MWMITKYIVPRRVELCGLDQTYWEIISHILKQRVVSNELHCSTPTAKGLTVNKIYPRQVKDTERPNHKQTIKYHINYECSEPKKRAAGQSPVENKDAQSLKKSNFFSSKT